MNDSGAALSQRFYEHLVRPSLVARWPGLPHAAGRLGSGSDVLGFDDPMSRDHDWGLRLDLLVASDVTEEVDAYLEAVLPTTFDGHPVRFPMTGDARSRHRVRVEDVSTFVTSCTGIPAASPLSVTEWLSLTGQAALEVTAGPLFADTAGELTAVRERLRWYPDDVWAYVVATDWVRLSEELPFIGRTAERGDDLGSRVITARLVGVVMHLAHLLERRWPPYAKWVGSSLNRLRCGRAVAEPLSRSLATGDWASREEGLLEAVRRLNEFQRHAGLPTVDDPVEGFWDRPYRTIRPGVVTVLEESITDPGVRALPRGVGSVEQRSDNIAVLVDPARRSASSA